jgi:hypothetical protein
MPPRSVTIRLHNLVRRASLPDNRLLQTTTWPAPTVVVSWETYRKISPAAVNKIIDVVSMNTGTPTQAKNGQSLTTNAATLPTNVAGKTIPLGTVLPGAQDYDAFKLVKLVGGTNATAGSVLVWSDKKTDQVTVVHAAGNEFAGVAPGAITSGNFGWIQTDGEFAVVQTSAAVAAGDAIAQDPANAGKARTVTGADVPFGSAITGIGVAGNTDAVARKAKGPMTHLRRTDIYGPR